MESLQRSDLIGQRKIRLEKIEQLKKKGINPYPSKSFKNINNNEILNHYEKYEGKEVIVAGRLMSLRNHGQIIFGHIQDSTERLQLYIKEKDYGKFSKKDQTLGFLDLELLDLGDIVEAKGVVPKTERGEISVLTESIRILTKAIRPLPDKWSGIKDLEIANRQKYLETIMDPKKKKVFEYGSEILFQLRSYLHDLDFKEIKTPVLQPLYGGTNAKPFSTYMNALGTNFFMAVSHELYLKRLITAGFDNVYNINGYYRNEGIDRWHNPEFQMLETMTAYKNYEYNMDLLENLYKHIAKTVFNKDIFKIGGNDVNLAGKWERISMLDAIKKYGKVDFNKIKTVKEAQNVLADIDYKKEIPETIGECMAIAYEELVEEKLIQPTIVFGHPVEISPLAKKMEDDPRFVERFELVLAGHEQGDNWTELNDPVELFGRFKQQSLSKKNINDGVAHPMDIEFIETMEYGMPPTTGLGPGIERLTMLFTESTYIDEVLFFPILKPSPVTALQKEIYGKDALEGNERLLGQTKKKQDFSRKIITVVDENLKGWELLNTVSHICTYLGNTEEKGAVVSQQAFITQDGFNLPANPQYPIVALDASQIQLKKLMDTVSERDDIKYLVYTHDMVETTSDKRLTEQIAKKKKTDLIILGIGVFGRKDIVEELTKKFGLYK